MGVPTWRRLGRGLVSMFTRKVVAAMADSGSGELSVRRMRGATEEVGSSAPGCRGR